MKQKGFTLIEILIAMAIIAILAGVGFTSYAASLRRSRDSQRKSDLAQVQRALEVYLVDTGLYPEASAEHKLDHCYDVTNGVDDIECEWGEDMTYLISDTQKLYMKRLPRDPHYQVTNYQYYVSDDLKRYQLFATLENTQDPSISEDLEVECGTGVVCNYGVASSNASPDESL